MLRIVGGYLEKDIHNEILMISLLTFLSYNLVTIYLRLLKLKCYF